MADKTEVKFGMSTEEVAWEITKQIAFGEKIEKSREYWLKLYSEALNAVQNPHQRLR